MESSAKEKKNKDYELMMSISGVRGIVGKSLTPEVLQNLIAAFSLWLGGKGSIILGRDSRNTGAAISQLAAGVFNLCGINVMDVGLVPTPTVQLMVTAKKANGGLVVTASHNPIQWNAFKFIKGDGTFLSKNEIEKMFRIYFDKKFEYKTYDKIGSFQMEYSAFATHIDAITAKINLAQIRDARFRVLIDSVGGAGSKISPLLLRDLGCDVVEHNTDITGSFPRGSEPTIENIKETADKVKIKRCHVGFCQDPDADRLAIIDENGNAIGEELTVALAVKAKLKKKKGSVVVNLSTSRAVEDIAREFQAPFYRAAVGEINVVDKMKLTKAVIGGEGNGGVIDPDIHLGRDSLVGIAYVLELMAEEKKSISQLVREVPHYVIRKETMPVTGEFSRIQEAILDNYQAGEKDAPNIDLTDGLRLSFENQKSWVHIRPSNTEPIIRLITEAPDENILNKISREIKKLVEKISKKKRSKD